MPGSSFSSSCKRPSSVHRLVRRGWGSDQRKEIGAPTCESGISTGLRMERDVGGADSLRGGGTGMGAAGRVDGWVADSCNRKFVIVHSDDISAKDKQNSGSGATLV
ncbi:unnamed protein product [Dibothriocephalus latus]|uniref:Uncharacterized protein n=1 Tax=Dibothriocephalus latus TaxID=60516 RepID=A0A3P6Q3T0_DIBLA|nr:unnamed protein product [Dibothriocephalus latus]